MAESQASGRTIIGCLICGGLSLPGAKLCLDCKAARKRAFAATVTEPLLAAAGRSRRSGDVPRLLRPGQSVPSVVRRAAKLALAAKAQARIAFESPRRRAAAWPNMAGVLCVGLAAVGYFGHWFGGGKAGTYATVPLGPPPVKDGAVAAANLRTPTQAPIALPSVAAANVAVAISVPAEPEAAAAKADAAKRANPRPRPEKAAVALAPPEVAPPPVIATLPPPPLVVRDTPRPDRWQLMAEAIARCPRDDFSSRYSCEQRVRAQHCEGSWGQVPQCASIPYNDHGQ